MRRQIALASALACALVLGTTGCTWVNLNEKGENVQIGYAGNVQECQVMGTVSAHTRYGARDEYKVQEELYTLARNNAGAMGATNLVQHAQPAQGEQSFTAYRCPRITG